MDALITWTSIHSYSFTLFQVVRCKKRFDRQQERNNSVKRSDEKFRRTQNLKNATMKKTEAEEDEATEVLLRWKQKTFRLKKNWTKNFFVEVERKHPKEKTQKQGECRRSYFIECKTKIKTKNNISMDRKLFCMKSCFFLFFQRKM